MSALWHAAARLYPAYLRQEVVTLAEGIFAVLGGGGNSLVVADREGLLVVDPKFGIGAVRLLGWLTRTFDVPVRTVVNTHYHYDHTHGNVFYRDARIWAHREVPTLMRERDGAWWRARSYGVPTELLGAGSHEVPCDRTPIVATHPGVAHTHGDLVLSLPRHRVVVTGDIVFHTYFPFFDTGKGGASVPSLPRIVRQLAEDHPDAVFVPGHGPLANAAALRRFADYVEQIYEQVTRLRAEGRTEAEILWKVDLRAWRLGRLPVCVDDHLVWTTARNNVRWAYQLATVKEKDRDR